MIYFIHLIFEKKTKKIVEENNSWKSLILKKFYRLNSFIAILVTYLWTFFEIRENLHFILDPTICKPLYSYSKVPIIRTGPIIHTVLIFLGTLQL